MLFVEDITKNPNFIDIEDLEHQLSELQYHLEECKNSLKEVEYHKQSVKNIQCHLRSLSTRLL